MVYIPQKDMLMGNNVIGFAYAEVYCVNCGRKEGYNALKPLDAPTVCRYCGGRMTDDATDKFIKELRKSLESHAIFMK